MSLIHYTLVGHFNPQTVRPRNHACSRPLDPNRVARLLSEYPEEVAAHVILRDGYAHCHWATGGWISHAVYEFAYHLAQEEGCLAVENGRQVTYPPEAAEAQSQAWEQLRQAWLAAESESIVPDCVITPRSPGHLEPPTPPVTDREG